MIIYSIHGLDKHFAKQKEIHFLLRKLQARTGGTHLYSQQRQEVHGRLDTSLFYRQIPGQSGLWSETLSPKEKEVGQRGGKEERKDRQIFRPEHVGLCV